MDSLIGRDIRRLRGGSSLKEFAKVVGISASSISNYERGVTQPKEGTIRKIERALKDKFYYDNCLL